MIKVRSLLVLGLFILVAISINSCCAFCNIESTIEYSVDTVYVANADTLVGGLIQDADTASSDVFVLIDHGGNNVLDSVTAPIYIGDIESDTTDWFACNSISDSIDNHYITPYSAFTLDTIRFSTEYADAEAWVYDSKLNGTIVNREYGRFMIDSLRTIIQLNETTISELNSNGDSYKSKYKRSRRNSIIFGSILSIIALLVISIVIKNVLKK